MVCGLEYSLLSLTILLLIITITQAEKPLKTSVFLSPKFTLNPGSVFQNTFYNIDFPKGHIAIKSFDLEIVDKGGNPLSIYHTYLHHYHVIRYYARKQPKTTNPHDDDIIIIKNKGVCDNDLVQYFGLGSESRNTEKYIPDPYGVVVGDRLKIPDGYEERWMVDVHVIDTRGVEDRMGCIECRCDVYNVTKEMDGQDLRLGYKGGLRCCDNNTKCRLQEGFLDSMATMFLKYTTKYVDWDKDVMPVDVYVLDVSTTVKSSNETKGLVTYQCQTEYDVKPCSASTDKRECVDSKKVNLTLPNAGNLIYAVAHQHNGGIGSSLYGQDGQVLCLSNPIYGQGTEPGNEAGYIVGMSTCYPKPGTAKIFAGESLTIVSNYSNAQMHTGVTGIFYIVVAESSPKSDVVTDNVTKKQRISYVWFIIMVPGVGAIMAMITVYQKRCKKDGYKFLGM